MSWFTFLLVTNENEIQKIDNINYHSLFKQSQTLSNLTAVKEYKNYLMHIVINKDTVNSNKPNSKTQ